MTRRAPIVTFIPKDPDQLPEVVSEGLALLVALSHQGLLELIADKVRIRRQGGYAGIDAVIVLLLYFASGQNVGMRTLWKRVYPFRKRLCAIAGRKALPSISSVFRLLSAVTDELLRPVAPWLLSVGAGIDELLRHPCVQTYDRLGLPWHFFDYDPTVTVLQHRSLPVGEDLPDALRRSIALAAPGFSGRKRGDSQVSRAALQHAGSSCWLWAELSPGNGDAHEHLQCALDVVVDTCQRLNHPLERALFRMDGAYGHVPYYTDCRERGVPFLTRLNRLKLFDQDSIRTLLREGSWEMVASSLGGPVRGALELGLVTLPAGDGTKRKDGSDYEPLTVRVVVSRYPRTTEAEHGVVLEGWQYEMFAIDAPIASFSAADAVAAYFGRAGQENRFAQEDREASLDRIFSYHAPGQELASVVGLWVWNLRVIHGFSLAKPPDEAPIPTPHEVVHDTRTAFVPRIEETPVPTEPAPDSQTQDKGCVSPDGASAADAHEALAQGLRALDWPSLLASREGWRWMAHPPSLLCPDGRPLVLTTVSLDEGGLDYHALIFCRRKGECEDCTVRASCLSSARPLAGKHIKFSVPREPALQLKQQLQGVREAERKSTGTVPLPVQRKPVQRKPARRPTFEHTPLDGESGPRAVHIPLFLPARARHLWREAALELTIRVTVTEVPLRSSWPLLLAKNVADRQHRRKTWTENVQRYAIDPEVEVGITFAGRSTLATYLQSTPQRATA